MRLCRWLRGRHRNHMNDDEPRSRLNEVIVPDDSEEQRRAHERLEQFEHIIDEQMKSALEFERDVQARKRE